MPPPCPQQTLMQALSLMTAWTHSACASLEGEPACRCARCGQQPGELRLHMACRIVELLGCLSEHPQLGAEAREGFEQLRQHWGRLLPRLQSGPGLDHLVLQ